MFLKYVFTLISAVWLGQGNKTSNVCLAKCGLVHATSMSFGHVNQVITSTVQDATHHPGYQSNEGEVAMFRGHCHVVNF